jgi:hypothetical protein
MSKKNVKKAIESVASGDVRGLKKNIQDALVSKVRKALDIKEKKIAKGLIEDATKTSIHEADVTRGSKTSISFPSKAECVVLGSDKGFDEVTKKKVTSGVRKGSKFSAKSTDDILSTLKCDKHQIQTDQLKKIKAGVKTLYVFVCPFHAYENGDRVVQVFADKNTAQEWYDGAVDYDSSPGDTNDDVYWHT